MKVVLDSNIFVSCLNSFSSYYSIFQQLAEWQYILCVSTEIIFEYLEVFQQKFTHAKTTIFYDFISESDFVVDYDIHFKWNLITIDPDDNNSLTAILPPMLIILLRTIITSTF